MEFDIHLVNVKFPRHSAVFHIRVFLLITCCAMLVVYQQDLFYKSRHTSYVYEFPNSDVWYPTLFLASKNDKCIPDNLLTVEPGGRLCNLILEYASTWAVAKLFNLTPFVPINITNRLEDVFESLSIPSLPDFFNTRTACHSDTNWEGGLHDVVHHMARIDMRSISLESALQTAKRTHKVVVLQLAVIMIETLVPLATELRREFRYKPELEVHAQSSLKRFRERLMGKSKEQVLFVGIHVRRTDYQDQLELLYGVTKEAGVEYYQQAVIWMRRKLSIDADGQPVNVVFVVASDDPIWCQDELIPQLRGPNDYLGRYEVYWGGQGTINTPQQDLALLSACNHSIIAYGTYGIWTALMAGGYTVVYNVTATNRYPSSAMQFATHMKHWIALR